MCLSACVCVLNRKTELLLVFAVLTFSKTPVKVIEMSSSLRNLHLLANIYTSTLYCLWVMYVIFME